MLTFEEYNINEATLTDLMDRHDDPFSFAQEAMNMIRRGTLKLKERGASNLRELVALFLKRQAMRGKK